MGYTPSFTPQYENGWENLPSETSPITAEAFNAYDDAIENIEEYLASDESQANLADAYDETATYEAGDYVIYGGDLYKCLEDIDEPEEWDSTKWESCLITDEMGHGGGGSTVSITPTLSTGTKIADFEIDGVEGELYAPTGGGGNANIWTGTQAELEEVFDELEDGTQINITDDEQEVVEGGTIYSEDEQVIGLWTDNRPLYAIRKHYTVNKSANVTLDFTEGEVKEVEGYIINSLNGIHFPLNASWSSTTEKFLFDDTHFYVNTSASIGDNSDLWLDVKYTKSTDAPLDLVVGKNTMYIASSDCYSTVEKEIGCHVDGKPIYQKSFLITSDWSFTANTWVKSNIPIGNIESIINGRIVIFYSNTYSEHSIQIGVVDGYIAGNAFRAFSAPANGSYLILQYTKSTDTAGSGQYTPASGKAVHYSTDEQVIGTWIDGSTLYRRVVPFTSARTNVQTNTWTELPEVDASNILQVTNSVLINYSAETPNYRVNIPCMCSTNRDAFNQHLAFAHLRPTAVSFPVGNMIIIEYTKITD